MVRRKGGTESWPDPGDRRGLGGLNLRSGLESRETTLATETVVTELERRLKTRVRDARKESFENIMCNVAGSQGRSG
jgi:hypothetical protein